MSEFTLEGKFRDDISSGLEKNNKLFLDLTLTVKNLKGETDRLKESNSSSIPTVQGVTDAIGRQTNALRTQLAAMKTDEYKKYASEMKSIQSQIDDMTKQKPAVEKGTFSELGEAAHGFAEKLGFEVNPALAAFGGFAAAAAASGLAIKKGLSVASETQTLSTQFGVLLKSETLAKDRMEELVDFANHTPFQLPEVAKADKVLETLTKGALSGKEGLKLVGDAAAASGAPYEELAMHIGRAYSALESGRGAGESMMRLQELGLVSGETRNKLEDLQKAGKKGDEVWGVLAKSLSQYNGMMEKQAQDFDGLTSTMEDQFDQLFRVMGQEFLGDASESVRQFTDDMSALEPVAKAVGFTISSVWKLANELGLTVQLIGPSFKQTFYAIQLEAAHGVETLAGAVLKLNSLTGKHLPLSMISAARSAELWGKSTEISANKAVDSMSKASDTILQKMAAVYAPDAYGKEDQAHKTQVVRFLEAESYRWHRARDMAIEAGISTEAIDEEHEKRVAAIHKKYDEKEKPSEKRTKKTDATANQLDSREKVIAGEQAYQRTLKALTDAGINEQVAAISAGTDKQITEVVAGYAKMRSAKGVTRSDLVRIERDQQAEIENIQAKSAEKIQAIYNKEHNDNVIKNAKDYKSDQEYLQKKQNEVKEASKKIAEINASSIKELPGTVGKKDSSKYNLERQAIDQSAAERKRAIASEIKDEKQKAAALQAIEANSAVQKAKVDRAELEERKKNYEKYSAHVESYAQSQLSSLLQGEFTLTKAKEAAKDAAINFIAEEATKRMAKWVESLVFEKSESAVASAESIAQAQITGAMLAESYATAAALASIATMGAADAAGAAGMATAYAAGDAYAVGFAGGGVQFGSAYTGERGPEISTPTVPQRITQTSNSTVNNSYGGNTIIINTGASVDRVAAVAVRATTRQARGMVRSSR